MTESELIHENLPDLEAVHATFLMQTYHLSFMALRSRQRHPSSRVLVVNGFFRNPQASVYKSHAMRSSAKRKGIAVTELAVVLPLFVFLGFMPLELGNFIQLKQSVSVAAYEAVKTATRPSSSEAKTLAVYERVLADRQIRAASIDISNDIDTLQPGDVLSITVTASFAENSFFNLWFLATSPTSTVTMIKE